MPVYEWKRFVQVGGVEGAWERAETATMDPPEGDGWQRVYSLGIGAVKGAGLSPARQVSGR